MPLGLAPACRWMVASQVLEPGIDCRLAIDELELETEHVAVMRETGQESCTTNRPRGNFDFADIFGCTQC
jgi:hypothetical protein